MNSLKITEGMNQLETAAEFKARRQLERRFAHWAWICDSHNCPWGIFHGGDGPEFVVSDCWTVEECRQPEEGSQIIENTAQLWQALGY